MRPVSSSKTRGNWGIKGRTHEDRLGPGSNFSAQNDVGVGLQWEDFFKENAAQNSYVFLGCIRLPTGV